MWISGTAQYAIRAVVHLALHGREEPLRVDAIAEALEVPRNYLSKTLHALARAGVLRSGRGPRGGFQLAEDPQALTLARVTAPFDDVGTRRCLLGRTTCNWNNPCSVHPRWEAVSLALLEFFRTTTVADLLGEIAVRPAMAPAADRGRARLRPGAGRQDTGAKRARGASRTRPKSP
ncbi:MAG TPA: Rrf2 family transcriptional regulator [Gemmatimonadaceae bacterium]|nr:MAG: hypothetical protein ABS52_16465 [Gemmatimonadetes bacterium SCN 70-22]HMN07197.1 Rrf2 family transcriptional regulator [Gemmatimonadaceae bacterium]